MPKLLTDEQVASYHRDGIVFPMRVLSEKQAASLLDASNDLEQRIGENPKATDLAQMHLHFRWAYDLVVNPTILDAVEDVLGPNIVGWATGLFPKQPRDPKFISWHQDGTYFYLDPALHVTAWVALSDADVQAGCMHVLPKSHKLGQFEHSDDPGEHNLILRGQAIFDKFDGQLGEPMALRAGEMSLHHTNLVHCSRPNLGPDRRLGFGISYIPARVRDVGRPSGSALLVRGRDHGHFLPEQRLGPALSEEAYANHERRMKTFRARQDSGAAIGRDVSYSEVPQNRSD